jgi:hypothetical protein
MGPGSDNDSILIIQTTLDWLRTGQYVGHRGNPGYVVHDTISRCISAIGGITLINLCTAFVTLIGVYIFYKILREDKIPYPRLWATAFALQPMLWVNATSLIDYNWALTSILIGIWAYRKNHSWLASGTFGLAIGIRLASFLVIPVLIGVEIADRKPGYLKRIGVAILGWGLGGIAYLPRFLGLGMEAFTVNSLWGGDWSIGAYIGRFIYKSIYFWGLPQFILIAIVITLVGKQKGASPTDQVKWTITLSIGIVLLFLGLFARYPLENEYLLPALPFSLYLIAQLLGNRHRWVIGVIAIILSYNLISINVLKPDTPNAASHVTPGLWVEPGYLIQDMNVRRTVKTSPIPHWVTLPTQSSTINP